MVEKLNYIFTKYKLCHMEAQVDSVKENIKKCGSVAKCALTMENILKENPIHSSAYSTRVQ